METLAAGAIAPSSINAEPSARKPGQWVLSALPLITLLCGLLPALPAQAQFAQQGPKLVGTGAIGAAAQGYSVSLSADGDTAIVGGPDNDGVGAAWVYTRSRGMWRQQAKLVGTGSAAICNPPVCAHGQGSAAALSGDGNTAIVGGQDGLGAAAWVFTRAGGVWSQQAELSGGGNQGSSATGVALSADGNTAIIGNAFVRIFFIGGFLRGEAWVYSRSNGVWSQQAELVDTSLPPDGLQGYSVSLSGDGNTAIVGAPFAGVFGEIVNGFPVSDQLPPPGAASVYTRSAGVWSRQAKLVGTGALALCLDEVSRTSTLGSCAEQGWSVSLSSDGDTAIVGGPNDGNTNPTNGSSLGLGAAWVFTRSGGVWSQQGAKLVGTAAVGNAGQGTSISLSGDGDTAIVGGSGDNNNAGAAWVFTRVEGVWSQQILFGTGEVGAAEQGSSVALSSDGNTAIVGGSGDNNDAGAAWVYSEFVFPGTPGRANCVGQRTSAIARQYRGLNGAAAALGFSSVSALQDAMMAFCGG